MTTAQALQLLVEAIDAQKAKSDGGPFVKLDWIELELVDAREALARDAALADVERVTRVPAA